jgi:hypothetical protein
MRRRRKPACAALPLLLVAGAFLLAGCGGSGDSGKVALIARSESQAKGGACDKVRDDAVNGRIVALYSCTLTGVPPAYRLVGSFDNPTQHFCFGYANDTGVNLTQTYGASCRRRA